MNARTRRLRIRRVIQLGSKFKTMRGALSCIFVVLKCVSSWQEKKANQHFNNSGSCISSLSSDLQFVAGK